MRSKEPLVSVRVITYNHERFLQECLDGIMAQETSFPFEVVIGEDCSTDGTRLICQEFQARYPDQVRLLLHAQNVGAQTNARLAREACVGKYIAFCEGDDYWTDPSKLQQQVDFLEAHLAYVLCFHNCWMKFEQDPSKAMELFQTYTKTDYAIPDLIGKWLIPTASVMFRNQLLTEYPEWLRNAVVGDTPFFILLASYGQLKLLPGIMAVYRRHDSGATTLLHGYRYWERMIELYTAINKHFGYQYSKEINPILKWFYYHLTQLSLQDGDYPKYLSYSQRCLRFTKELLVGYHHLGLFHYRYAVLYLTAKSPLLFNARTQWQVKTKTL